MKSGKAHTAGSGFGGKGLDRLEKDRDDKQKAERKAYGEPEEEKVAEKAAAAETAEAAAPQDDMDFGKFKVEIQRGPAPDTSKGSLGIAGAVTQIRKQQEEKLQASLKAAEEAASRAGKDTPAHKQALSVVAKLNAQLRAHRLLMANVEDPSGRKLNPDSTDFHAIIPINDYPQKARWRVTNKETMVQLIDMTGASVTNKGKCFLSSLPGMDVLTRYSQVYTTTQVKSRLQRDRRSSIFLLSRTRNSASNKLYAKSSGYS